MIFFQQGPSRTARMFDCARRPDHRQTGHPLHDAPTNPQPGSRSRQGRDQHPIRPAHRGQSDPAVAEAAPPLALATRPVGRGMGERGRAAAGREPRPARHDGPAASAGAASRALSRRAAHPAAANPAVARACGPGQGGLLPAAPRARPDGPVRLHRCRRAQGDDRRRCRSSTGSTTSPSPSRAGSMPR